MNTIRRIYSIILSKYSPQGWWPVNGKYYPRDYYHPKNGQERFEIIIGAILTQNTAWKNVEKSLRQLHKNKLLSLNKLRKIPLNKLAQYIKSSGYFNQKAKKIKAMIEFLESGKDVNRENLLRIWGVGPETADSILLYAYRRLYFVVDAYTKRIFSRLGLCEANTSYDELQKLFIDNLPKDVGLYNEYHALLVKLGKEVCTRKPKCGLCPLRKDCSYGIR